MNIELSKFQKGILLLSAGLVLLLYSTGLLTTGIDIIFVITSLLMLACGFYLVDGPLIVHNLFMQLSKQVEKKKESSQAPQSTKKSNSAASEKQQNQTESSKKNNSQK